jgi:manganese/zinc/iron transport system substrate-binding protein
MVADLARNVGGEHVVVEALMGEGVDPHLYKASTRDVLRLFRADVILYSGLHLEGKMTEIFERLKESRAVYAVTDAIPRRRLRRLGPEQADPHVWFDVELWSMAARGVERALAHHAPRYAAELAARGASYREELARLHAWCRRQVASLPREQRVLVTAHDAFFYFGDAYGLEVRAIQGISTDSEASVRDIEELVDFLARRRVKAVFVESSVSSRNVRALVEGCRARGHALRVGGELYSDAMGPPGTPEGTYVGMVRHNVQTIVQALR